MANHPQCQSLPGNQTLLFMFIGGGWHWWVPLDFHDLIIRSHSESTYIHEFSCKASKVIWEALKYCIPLRGLAEKKWLVSGGPDLSLLVRLA